MIQDILYSPTSDDSHNFLKNSCSHKLMLKKHEVLYRRNSNEVRLKNHIMVKDRRIFRDIDYSIKVKVRLKNHIMVESKGKDTHLLSTRTCTSSTTK